MPRNRRESNRQTNRQTKSDTGSNMTVREAGRMGGETVKEKYGPEFYSEIGHKGGEKVRELIEEGKRARQENE